MWRNGLALLLMAALAAAAWSIWAQLDKPVRSVRVLGMMSEAERQAIQEVVMSNLSGGILSLDADELVADIQSLSWPREVRVRRIWPDALTIDVQRESVVALWGDGGYLTSDGKVVHLADGPEGVPYLAASLSTPRQAMELYQLLTLRVAEADLAIVRLEENQLGEWLLTFDSGMTLALGNEALTERLSRFLLAYRRALATRAATIAHVDTRYDNGLAVRWSDAQLASVERSTR
ncbi:MAG: FtsQ-type POTRA domain-containing protein [Pseudomonadales bacterium]